MRRADEPTVGVAVDEARCTERAFLRNRRLLAVACDSPSTSQNGSAAPLICTRMRVVRLWTMVTCGTGNVEVSSPVTCHCPPRTRRRPRPTEDDAIELQSGTHAFGGAQDVRTARQRIVGSDPITRIARRHDEPVDFGHRAAAPVDAHGQRRTVDGQQIGTTCARHFRRGEMRMRRPGRRVRRS